MNSQQPAKDLVAYRCRKCGRTSYLRHDRCPACKSREFEKTEIRKEGVLLAYTKVYVTPAGVEKTPLTLGIVDFGEGVRILGQINVENPEIGMKLRPVWGILRKMGERKYYGFKFEPA